MEAALVAGVLPQGQETLPSRLPAAAEVQEHPLTFSRTENLLRKWSSVDPVRANGAGEGAKVVVSPGVPQWEESPARASKDRPCLGV